MQITLNSKKIECAEGKTILEVAEENGVHIPTLCYQKSLEPEARCRICLVEANGKLIPSCSTKIKDGMVISTDNHEVIRARKMNTELMAASHSYLCFVEDREHELCRLINDVGLREIRFSQKKQHKPADKNSVIIRDNNKCILCGRCVSTCEKIQTVDAITLAYRRYHTKVTPYFEHDLAEVACVKCGQCALNCPVGAIYERNDVDAVINALKSGKHVIAQTAPSVRATLGEMFGMEPGTLVTGKMVAALRRAGFHKVFDTDLGADLTIMEEANELLERVEKKGKLPLITSCSPGWINFVEFFYPELLPHVSTCKSPHMMFGAMTKSYYAKKFGINPRDITLVSIMPCTAKKFEIARPEMKNNGLRNVDFVLTTRETAELIRKNHIDFLNLPDETFDDMMGVSSGAGALFGATGGVMEAALRTFYETVTKKELKHIEFEQVRGTKGIKEATIDIDGLKVNIAVAHGLGNARIVLDRIKDGTADYHFVEIMGCPGGCIGGGGQPIPTDEEIIKKRAKAIYQQDRELPLRKSHENPTVKELYKEFLGKPLSKKAHEYLHTKYVKRKVY